MARMKPIPAVALHARSIIFSEQRLSMFDLDTGSRKPELVKAKEVLAWIGREKLGMSGNQIAKLCGWRSCSTAFEAANRVDSELIDYPYSFGAKFETTKDYAMYVYRKAFAREEKAQA